MTRPRVEGDRAVEILETTLGVLAEVGYDRLHLDAVAQRARVSKATIYRHWHGKERLVLDALTHALARPSSPPDTGSLRSDLLGILGDRSGLGDPTLRSAFSGILTAMALDGDLGRAVRSNVLAGPLSEVRAIFDRARVRGEVSADADVELLASVVVGFVTHCGLAQDDATDASESFIGFVDRVIVPAAYILQPEGRS